MIKVLMIEDDRDLADVLSEFLKKNYDISVTTYETPELGLSALRVKQFDIVILDLTLPDMDGVDVCKIITNNYKVPIIISSARLDISDKIKTLEMGADDYLPKPYDPRELAVRINSVLRRYNTTEEVKVLTTSKDSDFRVDENSLEIYKKEELLKLTTAEYEIFKLLIEKQGAVVSRLEIINSVDAINYESSEKSIDVIVSRIRQKIGKSDEEKPYIESVRGVGYKFKE
ncbi:MAG: response regulator transcription factor [Campylobacterales bacterium]|nr:response regulator transcription factor [Campylobacterales bacterium]